MVLALFEHGAALSEATLEQMLGVVKPAAPPKSESSAEPPTEKGVECREQNPVEEPAEEQVKFAPALLTIHSSLSYDYCSCCSFSLLVTESSA